MQYTLDLAKIPLDAYLALLKRQTLPPSRRMLTEDADGKFARIRAQGVASVAQLLKALSTPAKREAFAKQSGVDGEYLTVLRREAGTFKRKPVKLSAFPHTDKAKLDALAGRGILTSEDCFERGDAHSRLYALSDLTRINGIGPNAAAMFYEAGYRSVTGIANADAGALLARVTDVNQDHRYYAGNLGEKDMQFCIDYAKMIGSLC